MQTIRNHRSNRQKLNFRIRDRHRKRMIRKYECALKKLTGRLEAKQRMQRLRSQCSEEFKTLHKAKDKERKSAPENCDTFQKLSKHGPEYVCSVCHRLLYQKCLQVIK